MKKEMKEETKEKQPKEKQPKEKQTKETKEKQTKEKDSKVTKQKTFGMKIVKEEKKEPLLISVSCPAYADDVALVAETPSVCQKSVDGFQTALEWTRTLKAKPVKCRSLAFRLFRSHEKTQFKKVLTTQYSCFDPLLKINNSVIKFIGNDDPKMFKYLGRWVQYDLKDDVICKQVEEKLLTWLKTVDDSGLEGRMKAWITNFHVLSKISWLLMVQDFPAGVVERWRNHIHRKFRKWVGLAKSSEQSILYRSNEHFGLAFKDLIQRWRNSYE